MTIDVAELLYGSLPGVYRDKDVGGQLRRFLEVAAAPLAELEASITALQDDLFVETCRRQLIGLLGDLVGADVDETLPSRAQRARVTEAVRFYRSKGAQEPLQRFAERLTDWRVETVDFSQRVARTPVVTALDPVVDRRDVAATEDPSAGGQFSFHADTARRPLFDRLTGRAITRAELATDPAAYAGVEGRFTITLPDGDVFAGPEPRHAVTADLSDPADPRTAAGDPLVLATDEIAVDPHLGRFRFGGGAPLAGNVRVTFSALEPATITPQTLAVDAPAPLGRLGRSDDGAPYSVDLRHPAGRHEQLGRMHYDNQGFFCTPARVLTDRIPNGLPPGSGRFSFDDRPLAFADTAGVTVQLLDGIDGAPLTRSRLSGSETDFAGTARGFAIRLGGTDVRALGLNVRAADLTSFADPRDGDGAALALGPDDVAVDPQLGRFRIDPGRLIDDPPLRVEYLLGVVTLLEEADTIPLVPGVPELRALDLDGRTSRIVDAFDGTPVSVALRLGRTLDQYHGTPRGWSIRRNGTDLTGGLTAEVADLGDGVTPVPAGRLRIDPDRGRVRLPAGTVDGGDRITLRCAVDDPAEQEGRFTNLTQRLPRTLPAGVVAVVIDTRTRPIAGAVLVEEPS
jgi:phage tail-like protein